MVGQVGLHPDRTYPRSPLAAGGANTQALTVYVDDVDAHCERARAAGAAITVEPATQDYGEGYWVDRTYEAHDHETHHWWFMQPCNACTDALFLSPADQLPVVRTLKEILEQ